MLAQDTGRAIKRLNPDRFVGLDKLMSRELGAGLPCPMPAGQWLTMTMSDV